MAKVQLTIPDEDRDRFIHQARKEGLTLNAWLRAAAHERIRRHQEVKPFRSAEEVREFFHARDERKSGGREPDWEEHLEILHKSIMSGVYVP